MDSPAPTTATLPTTGPPRSSDPGAVSPSILRRMADRWWIDDDLTERQARNTRQFQDGVVEWGAWTFYRSARTMCIARFGAGGFQQGWRFATTGTLELAWSEITLVGFRLNGA